MTRPSEHASKPGGRLNALVVEDSPPMRKMIVFALSRIRELSVTEADDGVDALRRIASTKFDIIITDINMPRLDGIGLIKKLRADPSYKSTPILVLTTESEGSKKDEGRQAGATGWIVKPFDPDQLLKVVQKVCA